VELRSRLINRITKIRWAAGKRTAITPGAHQDGIQGVDYTQNKTYKNIYSCSRHSTQGVDYTKNKTRQNMYIHVLVSFEISFTCEFCLS